MLHPLEMPECALTWALVLESDECLKTRGEAVKVRVEKEGGWGKGLKKDKDKRKGDKSYRGDDF